MLSVHTAALSAILKTLKLATFVQQGVYHQIVSRYARGYGGKTFDLWNWTILFPKHKFHRRLNPSRSNLNSSESGSLSVPFGVAITPSRVYIRRERRNGRLCDLASLACADESKGRKHRTTTITATITARRLSLGKLSARLERDAARFGWLAKLSFFAPVTLSSFRRGSAHSSSVSLIETETEGLFLVLKVSVQLRPANFVEPLNLWPDAFGIMLPRYSSWTFFTVRLFYGTVLEIHQNTVNPKEQLTQ